MSHRWVLPLLCLGLVASAAACEAESGGGAPAPSIPDGGGGSDAGDGDGDGGADAEASTPHVIAPQCDETFCAQADVEAELSCYSDAYEAAFTMKLAIAGKTDGAFCAVNGEGAAQDLTLTVRAPDAKENDHSTLGFTLRGYTGPGTYPLYNGSGESDHIGLKLTGNAERTNGNADQTIGTWECMDPPPCEAIVAEGSDPIPTEASVKAFRVRAEVRCKPDIKLGDPLICDDPKDVGCSFVGTPTLRTDIVCAN